jgi:glycosyltransferase involved in cell wall biosynthesis
MTINFFLQSRDFGGAEQFAKDLLTEFARNGKQVFLYTSNSFIQQKLSAQKQIQLKKIPIYLDFVGNWRGLLKSLLITPLALIYYWRTLAEIKKRNDTSIILCSGFSEKIILAPLAHLFNLPIFFIEYGPLQPLFTKFFGLPKFLYFFAKQFAKQTIVSSEKTKKALSKIFPQKELTLIHCGGSDSLPKQKSLRQLPPTVTIISRLEKGKGQDLAIQAWQMIKSKPKNAVLQIVGQGSFEATLRKLAKNDPSIKFLAYVENKEQILQNSSIALCPSVWELEGFGLVVTEAMALAKPIVAFNHAPYNELIKDGHSALLAKSGDVKDLANKIERLLINTSLQKKLGQQARADFLAQFQIAKVAQKYLAVLQN